MPDTVPLVYQRLSTTEIICSGDLYTGVEPVNNIFFKNISYGNIPKTVNLLSTTQFNTFELA